MIIGVIGAFGKMGRLVVDQIQAAGHIAMPLDPKGREGAQSFATASVADVWIDFSFASTCEEVIALIRRQHKPLVMATTGHSPLQRQALIDLSQVVPVFISANFSMGIHRMRKLLELAVQLSQDEADIEIIDVHHQLKKDAPSGTALELSKTLSSKRSIPIHSLRIGSVVGDHTVIFGYDQETLEITHRAQSKTIFAKGALKAALYLSHQGPGLYTMDDLFKGENL